LQADAQAALFEEHADRGAGQTFAQRADDAAGDEDMFGHDEPPSQAANSLALAGKPQFLKDSRDREAAGGLNANGNLHPYHIKCYAA
jgi:hypothetical protein